jgi:hypothetical protein
MWHAALFVGLVILAGWVGRTIVALHRDIHELRDDFGQVDQEVARRLRHNGLVLLFKAVVAVMVAVLFYTSDGQELLAAEAKKQQHRLNAVRD